MAALPANDSRVKCFAILERAHLEPIDCVARCAVSAIHAVSNAGGRLTWRDSHKRRRREKLIAETQNSLVKFAIENEVHYRVMQFREGIRREKLGFTREIAAKLKLEVWPYDEDAMLKAVAKVAERLMGAEAEGEELRELGERLRRLVNCSSFAEAVERATSAQQLY
jgi:hypothetical protein